MNSMFSCFDALCADLLFAKTLRSFSYSSNSSSSQPKKFLIINEKATENVDGNRELAPEKTKEIMNQHRQQKKIRSAPEFDGLNCFETIVRY